jgi:hypothetical protein
MQISALNYANRLFSTSQWCEVVGDNFFGYCSDVHREFIWFEGSVQMAVAFNKSGQPDDAHKLLVEIVKARTPVTDLPWAIEFDLCVESRRGIW